MANLETGLLKLAAAKASWLVFPLGMIGIAAIWVWRARDRRSPPPRADGRAARRGERTSYRPASGPSLRGGTDREALLSQILEDNIRLREALK